MGTSKSNIQLVAPLLYVMAGICVTGATIDNSPSKSEDLRDNCELIVIAHRGASGYVPEHTLGAYALSITMGADYVEPDLVMTKDGHLVARHENEIGLSTDVAEHPEFASRYRTQTVDGIQASGWFTEDFTLEELKTLRAIERIPDIRPGNSRMDKAFDVPTIQEIIDLVKAMQTIRHRVIGIYLEIKHSTHFQSIGLPMEQLLVNILHSNGYQGSGASIFIQSFEIGNLKELRNLTSIRLIQLYDSSVSQPFDQVGKTSLTFGDMATSGGLREVATYAYGVGPEKSYIIPRDATGRLMSPTSFVADAHSAGLKVHPYTFRSENVFLPLEFRSENTTIGNIRSELEAFIAAGVDGLFTDQPDVPANLRGTCISSGSVLESINMIIISLITTLVLILS